jgi:Cu2+-exporting ATPase
MDSVAESSLRIGGMHCASCADIVERALRREPGVVEARVSAAAQCATVRWDPLATQAARLVEAVRAAGYDASPDTGAAARALRTAEARRSLWRLFVAAFCSMQIMMLAGPTYFGAASDLAPEYKRLLDWGSWLLTLPVLCFSAAPFLGGAWRALRLRRIGMDVPVALGIAVAFVASTGAAFDGRGVFGHAVYFDSLTMFIAFLLGGRHLELMARHRAEAALDDAGACLPQRVERLEADGTTTPVDVAALVAGDRVRVPHGDAFAADGAILEGATEADESLLTGESRPVRKGTGDAVVAGSLNLGAPVVMRVDRTGADTRYEAIAALTRAARTQRPALLATADRWAAPFLWCVLVLAAVAGAVWSTIDPSRTAWVVVSVLIVTCPCALSLAAPAALLAASGAMSRRGLLVRNLDAIASLARIETLFVDKTGTLTEASLRCTALRPQGERPLAPAMLGRRAAALADRSTHPLSRAIRAAFAPGESWTDVHELPGKGVEGTDTEGRRWRLGAPAWAADAGTPAAGQVVLARAGRLVAAFDFEEAPRPGAAEAIAALRADGVRVRLLSGDDDARVQWAAAFFALDSARGGLLPEDKLEAVRAAQREGRLVGMVGDGVNDAPVLAQADVSIAMGDGALVARAHADAVLVSGRLGDLAAARALARRALRVVRQNLAWAAIYNASCVPLALLGWLPPWAAGLGMASSSLVVVMNSLRLAR